MFDRKATTIFCQYMVSKWKLRWACHEWKADQTCTNPQAVVENGLQKSFGCLKENKYHSTGTHIGVNGVRSENGYRGIENLCNEWQPSGFLWAEVCMNHSGTFVEFVQKKLFSGNSRNNFRESQSITCLNVTVVKFLITNKKEHRKCKCIFMFRFSSKGPNKETK